MPGVVVLGSLNIDLIARVPRFPLAGETLLGKDFRRMPGGKGANQAVAAAAAGAAVRLIGRVGSDDEGAAYLEGLGRRGVDVAGVQADGGAPTGRALILVDDSGENEIVVLPGANARLGQEDVDRAHLGRGDVVLLQLEIPLRTVGSAVERARQCGARVLLNLSPYAEVPAGVLAACEAILVNQSEAARLPAGAVDLARLVVTRGAAGATWGEHTAPAPHVEVVDSTGAGDAFAGALAAALASGRPQPEALAVGVSAGARCVAVEGAQGWSL